MGEGGRGLDGNDKFVNGISGTNNDCWMVIISWLDGNNSCLHGNDRYKLNSTTYKTPMFPVGEAIPTQPAFGGGSGPAG